MVTHTTLFYKDLKKDAKDIPEHLREAHNLLKNQENKPCEMCGGIMIQERINETNKAEKYWFCTHCIYREQVSGAWRNKK
jgi:formamidopyrimidine-DNA glycosylase